MNVTFIEPGGDADFGTNLWNSGISPTIVSDILHGNHLRSLKFAPNTGQEIQKPVAADSGARISFFIYINVLPTATASFLKIFGAGFTVAVLRITSTGVLQLWNSSAQIGTNGSTLSTGQWYKISLAYTVTDSTHNRFEQFVNQSSSISITNASLGFTGSDTFDIGNLDTDLTLDMRGSDFYMDNSNALTDPGNIWVTAKRPNANGTTNGFTTQIGSGGSGYGTGHSPQINERPSDVTNGWSIIGAGSSITEEYTIEGKATGDIDISAGTIVDFMGWFQAKALISETAQMIVGGVSSAMPINTFANFYTKMANSTIYPTGSTDIGVVTDTTVTTVSLYECGIVVAYIPFITKVGSMLRMFQ